MLTSPQVLTYNHENLVNEKLEPLQQYFGLADEQLKKVVLSLPSVLSLNHDNLVKEKLEPLQQYFGLADEELKKIVLSAPQVLSLNHDNLVEKNLLPMQRILGLTDVGMKELVVKDTRGFGVGHIEEKWELMIRRFAEEEGDAKVAALRRYGPRGLGVGLGRLRSRLDDLDCLGCAPKASEWFSRLVMSTDERWATVLQSVKKGAA